MSRRFVHPARGLTPEQYVEYTEAIQDLSVVLRERQPPLSVDDIMELLDDRVEAVQATVATLERLGWTCLPPNL